MTDFDIDNIASLARIRIEEGRKKGFEQDFKKILSFVEQVQEVATDTDPSGRVGDVHNVMREDGTPHEKGVYTRELLEEVPSSEKGFVKVKKIL